MCVCGEGGGGVVCTFYHGLRLEKLQHNHGHTPTVEVHGC